MCQDATLVKVFTSPIKVCANYRPVFGTSEKKGISFEAFSALYSSDPLYSWIGLNSAEVYAAHKAAGGLTSFYRQLGIGCERLVRAVFSSSLGLSDDEVNWSYTYKNDRGKVAKLSLDARIDVTHIVQTQRKGLLDWAKQVATKCSVTNDKSQTLKGAVFEVRQGYKSADSKRQNADLRNAVRAYNENYVPVILLLSNQINDTVKRRYEAGQICILSGCLNKKSTECTYAFFKDVVGYDLASFFDRNQAAIQNEIRGILQRLVSA